MNSRGVALVVGVFAVFAAAAGWTRAVYVTHFVDDLGRPAVTRGTWQQGFGLAALIFGFGLAVIVLCWLLVRRRWL